VIGDTIAPIQLLLMVNCHTFVQGMTFSISKVMVIIPVQKVDKYI
jgi:hypothetical protein